VSPSHYFDETPDTPSRAREVRLVLPDLSVRLGTDASVFSADRIDPGTKLLLLEGPEPTAEHGPLLDLGCGYGPIAVTLAVRCPEATVVAVDVNERARELCRANAEALGVGDRVRVQAPDEVDPDLRFGQIWSNPPIRIGKAALHDLLTRWLGRLHPSGSAHLVVSKHLGADSLATWLGSQGMKVSRRRSRMGYRLLDVSPPGATT
jgi:16S rRNA (guanine1207-N2)-methyltransferase